MDHPLRITLVLTGYQRTGGARVLAIYANLLRRRGHIVTVVAPPPKVRPFLRRLKRWLAGRGWPRVSRHQPSFFDGFGGDMRLLDRFRPVVDDDLPDGDIVVATWWETVEWVAALHPSKGLKVHFVQGQEGSPLWFPPASIPRASAVYKLPFARVTISRSLVEWLETEHACHDVALVPNAVDPELFHAPARGRQPLPTAGLLYSKDPVKGVVVSLEALDRVRREIPNLQLVSFGFHGEVPRLPLPAGTRLYVNPPEDQLRAVYAQCDVWLCGSLVEGFALTPLEAMACRCPVVSTRVGGPDQLVVEGVNGYLVPVGDVAALAERLLTVLRLPEARWRAMSDAACATAKGSTWDDAATRLEAILRRLTASRALLEA